MTTLNFKSITTIAAACALSLASAAVLAAPGGRAPAASGMHAGTTAAKPTTTTTTTRPTTRSTATTHTTGQPNASCETTPNQPGHSISAPGSAFNPDGVSGTKYAGEQPQNQKNPTSVSQYDVACTRPSH